MVGMIEPRRLIITTLSFRSECTGDLDHRPAQRGADYIQRPMELLPPWGVASAATGFCEISTAAN
jgi:hypothetical protein